MRPGLHGTLEVSSHDRAARKAVPRGELREGRGPAAAVRQFRRRPYLARMRTTSSMGSASTAPSFTVTVVAIRSEL